ncbi:MAG: M4 family metallopeptidase, partial [Candidatus Fimenecus sp.]
MRCPECGTEIKDTHKFCPKCGYAVNKKDNENKAENIVESKAKIKTKKDKKKRRTKIIACICAVSILISGTIGGLIFYFSLSTNDFDNKYICLDAGFTDVIIKSEDDAIKAAQSVAGILGITDAEKELKISNVNKVDGDTYYRMQQYYNDIPVYGRSVVVAADADGNATALTSNTVPAAIDSNLDFSQPDFSKKISKYVHKEMDKNAEILYTEEENESNRVIYTYGNKPVLAYNLTILTDFGAYGILVDAKTGKVLFCYDELKFAQKTFTLNGQNGTQTFIAEAEDNGNNKMIYESKSGTVITVSTPKSKHKYDWYYDGNADLVEWENDKKVNKSAVDIMTNVTNIYNYYLDTFSRDSLDGNKLPLKVYVNISGYRSYDNEDINMKNNAFYWLSPNGSVITSTLRFDENGSSISEYSYNLDVMAHEYTHGVIRYTNQLEDTPNNPNPGAINEGIADIFGVLAEQKIMNWDSPDWQMADDIRNLQDPAAQNYPIKVQDENNSGADYCHGYSTVISHAAYLMWNGIDGNESMKIDSDTLAKLWYRALFLLQSDATFSQCRNAVELSARIMVKNKQLTAEQYESVTKAFDAVGIDTAPYTYAKTVKNDFDLSVLSHEETENVNFNLTIYKMPVIKAGPNIKNTGMPKKVMKKTSLSGKQHLHLEDGTYILELRDIADDQNQTQPITAKIVVNGKNKKAVDEVKIYTDFTDIITVVLNDEESMYYRYIQENLEVLDLDLFPDGGGNNKGVFSALIRDFDNDGNKELITFSITYNAASQEYLVMHLYKIIQGAVTLCDTSDEMFASGAGNFQNDFCGTLEENCIKLQYSVGSYGYSSFGEQYRTYAIAENQFVLKEDFKLYEAYRYDDYEYEEMVSGKQYSSNEDFIKAVETAGFDVSLHHHVSYENSGFNPETDDYKTYEGFRGNHIFALYNSRDMNGDYGFIYDNTNLRQYIDVS